MRRGAAGLWGAAALCLVLSGCGAPGIAQPREVALPVDAMACTDSITGSGTVIAGTVPEDIELVAILRCVQAAPVSEAGVTRYARVTERYEGDLSAFVRAVNAASDPRWFGACTTDMVIAPDLWAETGDGRFVNLSYPSTGCGKPKSEEIEAALARIDLAATDVEAPAEIPSSAATSAGCSSRATVMVRADGPESTVERNLPTFPASDEVSKMRVCVYVAPPSGDGTAPVVAVYEMRTPDARSAVALAAAAPEAPACTSPATRFSVAHPILTGNTLAAPFTVELDGCGRVIDPAMTPRQAPAALAALLAR